MNDANEKNGGNEMIGGNDRSGQQPDSTAKRDNVAVYDRLAGEYDAWYDEQLELFRAEVEAVRRLLAPGTVLEVGAGSGRFSAALGVDVAVEPSENMRRLAAARGVEIVAGTAERLPFSDGLFDAVLFLTVLEFVDDADLALAEARRVLKAGGSLIVAFLNEDSPEGQRLSASRADDEYYAGAVFYSRASLAALLARHGFAPDATVQVVSDCCRFTVRDGSGAGLYTVMRAVRR